MCLFKSVTDCTPSAKISAAVNRSDFIKAMRFLFYSIIFLIISLPNQAFSQDNSNSYFNRKTITVYIGRSAGSGTDLIVRLFTKYWQTHIPGDPQIIVRNIPGGGGTRVWNYGYEVAKPDGLSIFFSPFSGPAFMVGAPGLRANFEEMPLVGGLRSPNLFLANSNLNDPTNQDDEIIFGGQNPTHHYDIVGRIALDLLGLNYRYIYGFNSANDVLNALRRGEIDAMTIGVSLYRFTVEDLLVNQGTAFPMWHNPRISNNNAYIPDSSMSEIPAFEGFYFNKLGYYPSGNLYEIYKWLQPTINTFGHAAFLPPETDSNLIRILQESFIKTTEDDQYRQEELSLFSFNMPIILPQEGRRIVSLMANPPEHVSLFLESYVNQPNQ
jgi:hypothetical protein